MLNPSREPTPRQGLICIGVRLARRGSVRRYRNAHHHTMHLSEIVLLVLACAISRGAAGPALNDQPPPPTKKVESFSFCHHIPGDLDISFTVEKPEELKRILAPLQNLKPSPGCKCVSPNPDDYCYVIFRVAGEEPYRFVRFCDRCLGSYEMPKEFYNNYLKFTLAASTNKAPPRYYGGHP